MLIMSDALETEIPHLMQAAGVIGLSVAQIKDATIVWRQGFGIKSQSSSEPVTVDTIFEAASFSKPVCAYAALMLCEQGVLELDTPLALYLPEPNLPDEPRFQRITMRHVLSHVTGLPNWRPRGAPLQMHFEPGDRFSYSGEGYVYLQRVIEHVTAQPLANYLATNVFRPLGMFNSSFIWTEDYETLSAQGHDQQGNPVEKFHPSIANAASSLHTSPTEFAHFLLALMQPSPGTGLHPGYESLAEMLRPQVQVNDAHSWQPDWFRPDVVINDRVSWGLGWGIQHHAGGDTFWHWGDNGCFKAFAIGNKQRGTGLVLMSNSANASSLWAPIVHSVMGQEQPGLAWLSE